MKRVPVYLSRQELSDILMGLNGGWKEDAIDNIPRLSQLAEKLVYDLETSFETESEEDYRLSLKDAEK